MDPGLKRFIRGDDGGGEKLLRHVSVKTTKYYRQLI